MSKADGAIQIDAMMRTTRYSREHHLSKAMSNNTASIRSLERHQRVKAAIATPTGGASTYLEKIVKNHVSVGERMREAGRITGYEGATAKTTHTRGRIGTRTGRLGQQDGAKEVTVGDFRGTMGLLCEPVFDRPNVRQKYTGHNQGAAIHTVTKPVISGSEYQAIRRHDAQGTARRIQAGGSSSPRHKSTQNRGSDWSDRPVRSRRGADGEEGSEGRVRLGNTEMNRILEDAQRKLRTSSNPQTFVKKGGVVERTLSGTGRTSSDMSTSPPAASPSSD